MAIRTTGRFIQSTKSGQFPILRQIENTRKLKEIDFNTVQHLILNICLVVRGCENNSTLALSDGRENFSRIFTGNFSTKTNSAQALARLVWYFSTEQDLCDGLCRNFFHLQDYLRRPLNRSKYDFRDAFDFSLRAQMLFQTLEAVSFQFQASF